MRLTKKILLLSFLLLPVQGVWAVDADLDGSDSYRRKPCGYQRQRPHPTPLLVEDL